MQILLSVLTVCLLAPHFCQEYGDIQEQINESVDALKDAPELTEFVTELQFESDPGVLMEALHHENHVVSRSAAARLWELEQVELQMIDLRLLEVELEHEDLHDDDRDAGTARVVSGNCLLSVPLVSNHDWGQPWSQKLQSLLECGRLVWHF